MKVRNWTNALPLTGCMSSLLAFSVAILAASGYELALYHPAATALFAAVLATAAYGTIILGKPRLSGAGVLAAWLMPFAAALAMAGWPKMGGSIGTICGTGSLLLSQAAFWRCVESKRLRAAASFTAIGLTAAGILIAWLMIALRISSHALSETVFGLLFVGLYLLTGALVSLCSMAEKRWSKNMTGIFVPLAAFGLMILVILTHSVFRPREYYILQSAVSQDGSLIAEEYHTENASEGSIRVRENSEGVDILVGWIRKTPHYVQWHYGSATVDTLGWLDEDTLLINGDAWLWRYEEDEP